MCVTDVTNNVTHSEPGQKPDKRRTGKNSTEQQMLKAVRNAERTAGDGADIGGTGFTILKMRPTPLERLIEAHKIGMEEIQAAEEIETAFLTITSQVRIRAIGYERIDSCGGHGVPFSARAAAAMERYQKWAKHWTRLKNSVCDPMLEVVISAVVDEKSIREIAATVERHHSLVQRGIIAGLRDYAARAGFVSGGMANAWITQAAQVFTSLNPRLSEAIYRARVEI